MAELPNLPPPPPTQATSTAVATSNEANQWAMFIHLSVFAGFVVPFAGLILPIVLWQMKKAEFPSVDAHGKMVANFIISLVIYSIACLILTFVLIGILGFLALGVVALVFPIIGGIKANSGEFWPYPLTIKFIK